MRLSSDPTRSPQLNVGHSQPNVIFEEKDDDDEDDTVDHSRELLLRHSSPLLERTLGQAPRTTTSVLFVPSEQRSGNNNNTSPSPLRLNRPRSNPRNRTPNRMENETEEPRRVVQRQEMISDRVEGRRITIRPMAGAAVGTNMAGTRIRETARAGGAATTTTLAPARSRKQGPSHRKVRRWNNDNFVNLAAEIKKGGGSLAAAEALLLGSNHISSKHRSILDPLQHQSKAMAKFRENELSGVRQQFFNGELPHPVLQAPVHSQKQNLSPTTPEERFYGIESRLRRVIVKACENSYAASQVVNRFEDYLIRLHSGQDDCAAREEWLDLLLESPTVTSCRPGNTDESADSSVTATFLFDADSSTGGFHRLLLHGVCQYHGLTAVSSTRTVNSKKARVLTASGILKGSQDDIGLVDWITQRQNSSDNSHVMDDRLEKETRKLATLKV